MERRNSSVSLLSCAVPELEADVQPVNDSILKGEVIANSRDSILLKLFAFQPID